MKTIRLPTTKRAELLDITSQVTGAVKGAGVEDGVCVVFCPHTTAGLTINENADPSVKTDIVNQLEELVPPGASYSHTEGNADAHIKASLVGFSVNIIINGGKLVLGTWQGIFFCEFDGPRSRKVHIDIR